MLTCNLVEKLVSKTNNPNPFRIVSFRSGEVTKSLAESDKVKVCCSGASEPSFL